MVEITHRGTGFKWSSLDWRDKRLAVVAIAASAPGAVLAGIVLSDFAYEATYALTVARSPSADTLRPLIESAAFKHAALVAFVLAIISALAWWRFSLRQDELFNGIQNYALGRAGGWSMGIATGWWLLQLAGLAGPFSIGAFVLTIFLLTLGFWFHGVRRWA